MLEKLVKKLLEKYIEKLNELIDKPDVNQDGQERYIGAHKVLVASSDKDLKAFFEEICTIISNCLNELVDELKVKQYQSANDR